MMKAMKFVRYIPFTFGVYYFNQNLFDRLRLMLRGPQTV